MPGLLNIPEGLSIAIPTCLWIADAGGRTHLEALQHDTQSLTEHAAYQSSHIAFLLDAAPAERRTLLAAWLQDAETPEPPERIIHFRGAGEESRWARFHMAHMPGLGLPMASRKNWPATLIR